MKPYTCKQLSRWLSLQIYKVTFHIVWCYGYYTCTRISDFFCFCLIKEAGSDMNIISVYTPICVLPVWFSELDKLGYFNSLTTKKQTTKFSSANFQKCQVQALSYCEFKDLRANSVDLDGIKSYAVCKFSYFRNVARVSGGRICFLFEQNSFP